MTNCKKLTGIIRDIQIESSDFKAAILSRDIIEGHKKKEIIEGLMANSQEVDIVRAVYTQRMVEKVLDKRFTRRILFETGEVQFDVRDKDGWDRAEVKFENKKFIIVILSEGEWNHNQIFCRIGIISKEFKTYYHLGGGRDVRFTKMEEIDKSNTRVEFQLMLRNGQNYLNMTRIIDEKFFDPKYRGSNAE